METEQVYKLPLITILRYKDKSLYAARLQTLGLTGYGSTPDEAEGRLHKMLRAYLHRYSADPLLSRRLREAGITIGNQWTEVAPKKPTRLRELAGAGNDGFRGEELRHDKKFMSGVKKGLRELHQGKGKTWDEVKAERGWK